MNNGYLKVEHSQPLVGEVELSGAKNAVLVTIASLILVNGISTLYNVPVSADVIEMIELLQLFGAISFFDTQNHILTVDTRSLYFTSINTAIMQKTRASILIMGPLLVRFGVAKLGFPGGDAIGKRPIDYHIKSFKKLGVIFNEDNEYLSANAKSLKGAHIVLEYPSVGATENILMAAICAQGTTKIINAACEPEVFDLIDGLCKMGAKITVEAPATIIIEGVNFLQPIEHTIMVDRLEAGSLLISAAATKGEITITNANARVLDVFLFKLQEMGHGITIGSNGIGIHLNSTQYPNAVSFKTGPYPNFPTDLQAPMMALQCMAEGVSVIEETVFENRFHHAYELIKMGANIEIEYNKAIIKGVKHLYGMDVIAKDIRASTALVIAGFMAQGTTIVSGLHHWRRGYEKLENKLQHLGARVTVHEEFPIIMSHHELLQKQSLQ